MTLLFSLFLLVADSTKQSPTHFQHTVQTTASPEQIWVLWTDVNKWPHWDLGLRQATLNSQFAEGATGTLVPDKGPVSKFRIEDVDPGKSYTLVIPLPLGSMRIKRTLFILDNVTNFTHDVEITGLAKLYLRSSGKRYNAILPDVMQKIKMLAEQASDNK